MPMIAYQKHALLTLVAERQDQEQGLEADGNRPQAPSAASAG